MTVLTVERCTPMTSARNLCKGKWAAPSRSWLLRIQRQHREGCEMPKHHWPCLRTF